MTIDDVALRVSAALGAAGVPFMLVGYSALSQRNEMPATAGRRVRPSVMGWSFPWSQHKK